MGNPAIVPGVVFDWHASEGQGGANLVQSQSLVDLEPKKDSRQLKINQMTHVLKNIGSKSVVNID